MEKNENGYSGFIFGNRSRNARGRDGACPGTGDMWEENGNNGNHGGNNGNMNGVMPDVESENMGAGDCQGMKCSERPLGMVYSPFQCWRMLYDYDKALKNGTLFEELYKPLEEGR